MPTLYLIATPIGNLEDISARALRLLREVSLIAAEDTRQTRKLLSHYNIHTPATSYYEHNKMDKLLYVLGKLEQGDVALVSDAGTPGLNDPGYELVRAALQSGHRVSPVPGPSAPLAALVASGLPTDTFIYLGYLPRRAAERRKLLQEHVGLKCTLVCLEAPHRLLESLQDALAVLGDRQAAVARELTKLHEEIVRGPISSVIQQFVLQAPRGEITLVIAGAPQAPVQWSEAELDEQVHDRLARGQPPSQAAAELSASSGWPRREIYRRLTQPESKPRP